VHYDPLLAKLVTWGRDRSESLERMRAALARTAILGVITNHSRLQAVLEHPAFEKGELHTGFIEEHLSELTQERCPPPEALAAAVAAISRQSLAPARGRAIPDPWGSLGSWRLP
jgi:acetyl/propionyl-CoA carboxylase alpha subunit